jgi:putative ATP-binding cassette transporter
MNRSSAFLKAHIIFIVLIILVSNVQLNAQETLGLDDAELGKEIQSWMELGKIPGMSIVIVREGQVPIVKGYGVADLETKIPVTSDTLFELCSLSKSFTALAALRMEEEGLIELDKPVSHYLPWFSVNYKGEEARITIRQLLHHTSGIPWETISKIPQGDSDKALENTVRKIVGLELQNPPGETYHYATINYDIVGAVMEKISGRSYEHYMRDYLFTPMGLTHTTVGKENPPSNLATGYKIGFFSPRKYTSPPYRGNNPSAYIISNAKDMAMWLKYQIGAKKTEFESAIKKTHIPDVTVNPSKNWTSYAMGWFVNQYRKGEMFHSGLNPNFTAFIGIKPDKKIGVVVLSNSNSGFTQFIGNQILKKYSGEKISTKFPSENKVDIFCSIISFSLVLYMLFVLIIILTRVAGSIRGKNKFAPLKGKTILKIIGSIIVGLPFLYGIYLIPEALSNLSWETILVWAPISFHSFVLLLLSALVISYLQYFLSFLFPSKNKYRNEIPIIAVISVLSGLAGTALLFIVTTSFFSTVSLGYLLYYYALAYIVNILGRKIVQTKMIKIANNIALDLRIHLINRIITTKFQHFEKMHDGRILTTLNGDTSVLANSAGLVIYFITNVFTAISAFIYMATISIISTLVVLIAILIMTFYYRIVSKKSRVFLEEARDTQNVYMSLLNHLIRGYKELSIHRRKKYEFKEDLIDSSRENCIKSVIASVKFLNANIVADSIILIILGTLSIVISRVISGTNVITLISFVMVLLYLISPIRVILNSIPNLTRIKVSWGRIKDFVRELNVEGGMDSVKEFIRKIDLPTNEDILDTENTEIYKTKVEKFQVEGLKFQYENEEGEKGFSVGPIDFSLNRGEVLFVVGGNGSGKTTAAKLMTGLYVCDNGHIRINGKEVPDTHVGEYFSTIFSDYHLFDKLYNIDPDQKKEAIQKYLELLNLQEKVKVVNGSYSTLNLSGGQRKRLALMSCYLDDRQIFLFDELAADQDPEFRKFFYRDLLVKMKEEGKIIIAITHDDHYFDVADKIIKLDMGKVDFYEAQENSGEDKKFKIKNVKG